MRLASMNAGRLYVCKLDVGANLRVGHGDSDPSAESHRLMENRFQRGQGYF